MKLYRLPEYREVMRKTQDFGGIDPEMLKEKSNINGCCGAGDPYIAATVFDLILQDMKITYHNISITDQSMLTYYAYNGYIPSLNLHPDGLLMADQTKINTSVFGQFREINSSKLVKGKFKWLHHLNYRLPKEFLLEIYRHCPRDDINVKNYFPRLSDFEIDEYERKMKKNQK
ncbi:hypothetical protein TVAG_324960 [Trichomonas vaginalis G3]|uniref:Uncharacterized protein n=1 Tax=Trichomonas vaginalis (strain ATCC PRA-98 / G3) TaxID=412133 RepID=A2F131_TRIV3|nr:hypothetical protein TVAGG3_0814960 [Trichomonas vaginalis G3]EAY01382.1 hypothetical protein TVAG_324960 [Trichomonas vaginalis G3]KAI5497468.1 hypothetical protein TVAGG3_0814960 [Trichomonas vaginalis G3]|eukprot:XP_001330230.1 hypothetical protein [Trichomonas vaginalis G3]